MNTILRKNNSSSFLLQKFLSDSSSEKKNVHFSLPLLRINYPEKVRAFILFELCSINATGGTR